MDKDNDPNIATMQDDGAGEKLVDEKNGHNSKGIEIKFMTPTSQNGDAKIDIENVKSAFAGMGKEELMKFASDPFWVRTRWFLFILFWLLWIAMLAGAIAIIVLAPKCAPSTPREWWEQSPLYKTDVANFYKDTGKTQGDLKGFTTKLDYLKQLGVETVVLSNILKAGDKDSDGEEEFKTVASSYGTLDDLKSLIKAAKDKGLKLLLTLVPNHSSLKSTLFNKSIEKDPIYSSYFVWGPGKGFSTDGQPIPPNNWLSQNGGSAWEWNEKRGEFYLHQFNKTEPEFDFNNPDVVNYFSNVMKYWLDLGVSGFFLEHTPYLLEDKDLRNESVSRNPGSATHTDYGFYDHSRTKNLPELAPILRKWKDFVSNSSGILVLDSATVAGNRSVAHLTVQPLVLEPYPIFSAEHLYTQINSILAANSWPVWQVQMKDEPEGSRLHQAVLLTTMLLPGVPVTKAGQELGLADLQQIPWQNITGVETKISMHSAYQKLVEKRRSDDSVRYGTVDLRVLNGSSVLAYTRLKSGKPGYLVVFNCGEEETEVDVGKLDSVPEELTLLLTSDTSANADKTKVMSKVVSLPGQAVAVFTFVPKAKE